eukprot:TRINITY_DN18688_c0_g1_i1.p1 TRINITY_DN18688_c0_g1~~TRINITY_DN18688_c0_g1_i1.p1  ORF type:complete len:337 (-),score=52.54 TRINITY_DN18688_c0_g1_i1:66-1076(-)
MIIWLGPLLLTITTVLTSYFVYIFNRYKLPPSPSASFFENIVIGHRGCNLINTSLKFLNIPENTLSAFTFANDHGVDGVEMDITLSKDLVPVVMHDSTTSRLLHPPAESPDLPINVSSLTLDQLHSLRFRKEQTEIEPESENLDAQAIQVPTFKQVLELTQRQFSPKLKLMIELKPSPDPQHLVNEVETLFNDYDLYENAVVGSFDPVSLYLIRKRNPRIVTLLLVCRGLLPYLFGSFWIYRLLDSFVYLSCMTWLPFFLGVGVVGVDNKLINDGSFVVEDWQKSGYVVNSWTVNKSEDYQTLRSKRVAVTTDFLFSKFLSGALPLPQMISNSTSS